MEIVETIIENGFTIKIMPYDMAESPRTAWDNLGHMVCFHSRYTLGDKTNLKSDMFDSWQELQDYLKKEEKAVVILPVYMYDHSGITINTTGFSCPWDSGQIGFIYVTKDDIKENWGIKRISKKKLDHAKKNPQRRN